MRKETHPHKWTEEEDNILRQSYCHNVSSATAISLYLNIPLPTVLYRIRCLGLCIPRLKWSSEMDEQLTDLIGALPPKKIAKRMHLDVKSVILRSKQLHLSRLSRDGWYTLSETCQILGVSSRWLHEQVESGQLRVKPYGDIPLGTSGAKWYIKKKELRKFIIHHAADLCNRHIDLFQIVEILVGNEMIHYGQYKEQT